MIGTGFRKLAVAPSLSGADQQLRSKCITLGLVGAVVCVLVGFLHGVNEYILSSIVVHGLAIFAFYVPCWLAPEYPRLGRWLIVALAFVLVAGSVVLFVAAPTYWVATTALLLYPVSFAVFAVAQLKEIDIGASESDAKVPDS